MLLGILPLPSIGAYSIADCASMHRFGKFVDLEGVEYTHSVLQALLGKMG